MDSTTPDQSVAMVTLAGVLRANGDVILGSDMAKTLDFSDLFGEGRFGLEVQGPQLSTVGILSGDVIIVDETKPVVDGSIVVARCGADVLFRRFEVRRGRERLYPEPSPAMDAVGVVLLGVVTGVVRTFSGRW
jgi:SOS-response transcriptional repressor LexA